MNLRLPSWRTWLYWVLAAGILLGGIVNRYRAAALAQVGEEAIYAGDYYYPLGINLSRRHVLSFYGDVPTAFRGPLYPAAISLLEPKGTAASPRRVFFAHAVLSSFCLLLVFWIGRAVHSRWTGLLAAALLAFHSPTVQFVQVLELITFYSFLLVLVAAALSLWAVDPSRRHAVFLGLSIGLSLTCRSTLFLFPVLLLALCRFIPRYSVHSRTIGLVLLLSYLPLVPWMARNVVRFGAFIPFERHAAANNMYLASQGEIFDRNVEIEKVTDIPGFQRMTSDEQGKALIRTAVWNVVRHPLRYAGSCVLRVRHFWSGYWWAVAFALLGLFLGWRKPEILLLGALPLTFSLHALMLVSWRYPIPISPLLFVLAAVGAVGAFERLLKVRRVMT